MKVHVNTDRGLCKEHILIIFSMTPHEGVELRLLNTGSRVQSNHSPLEKLEVAWSKSYLTLACGTITGDKKKKSYKLLSPASNKSHIVTA